jgi:ribosome-associated heat shock protein Hsp15
MATRARAEAAAGAGQPKLRIDKWLWAARFYKTRSVASAAVEAGQVRVDGERVKPSRAVHAGETVEVRKAGLAWTVEVTGVDDRRGSAADAARLYREHDDSRAAREEELARRRAAAASAPVLPGRPTKRDRRKLEDFLNEP